jgi:plasmid stabilization system protein ParE
MTFRVRLTDEARDDLRRLYRFPAERDIQAAERALDSIERNLDFLSHSPFSCRKAGDSPLIRELVIPFGGAGYVALFSIEDGKTVTVAAFRHQREDDYH